MGGGWGKDEEVYAEKYTVEKGGKEEGTHKWEEKGCCCSPLLLECYAVNTTKFLPLFSMRRRKPGSQVSFARRPAFFTHSEREESISRGMEVVSLLLKKALLLLPSVLLLLKNKPLKHCEWELESLLL